MSTIRMVDIEAIETAAQKFADEIAKQPPAADDAEGQMLAILAPAVLRVIAGIARDLADRKSPADLVGA